MIPHIKISVIICTYNREEFLPGLFKSIISQTLDKTDYEILLINNNSTDNTENICLSFIEQHPSYIIRYIIEPNQGLSFARNRGIQDAHGKYITFADDDALLTLDFLEKTCHYLNANNDICEVGGPIFLQYIGKIPAWESPYMNSLLGYFNPSASPYVLTRKNRKYPRGSNMTFKTDVLRECGLFNTNLGRNKRILLGGEEKDIAFRLLDAGHKIAYSPEIIVYHLVPEERTTFEFIKRQALGTGQSERIRAKMAGELPKRIIIELFKWGITLLLWARYMFTFTPQKANMLVCFRFWISKGLFHFT